MQHKEVMHYALSPTILVAIYEGTLLLAFVVSTRLTMTIIEKLDLDITYRPMN